MTRPRKCDFCPTTDGVAPFAGHWMCEVCRHLSLPIEPTAPSGVLLPSLTARRGYGVDDGAVVRRDGPVVGEIDRTAARGRALGADVAAGDLTRPFTCVLPGHQDHTARLRHSGGHWKYSCAGLDEIIELAQVRACVGYQCLPDPERPRKFPLKLRTAQRVAWRELLDYEAGLSTRGPARIPLPPRADAVTRRVGDAWRLQVGLRNPEVFAVNAPFLLARRYLMARAGVSFSEARHGVEKLEEFGSLIRVGVHRPTRAILWRPGPTLELFFGSPDLLVEEFKRQFGAEAVE